MGLHVRHALATVIITTIIMDMVGMVEADIVTKPCFK